MRGLIPSVLALVALAVAGARARQTRIVDDEQNQQLPTSPFIWAQNQSTVTISLKRACKVGGAVKITYDRFAYRCPAEFDLSFRLSTDVLEFPASYCTPGKHGRGDVCYLKKRHQQLWISGNLYAKSERQRLRGLGKVDWNLWEDEPDNLSSDAGNEGGQIQANENLVPVVRNASHLKQLRTQRGLIVLWAEHSWCTKCHAMHPVFLELAQRLEDATRSGVTQSVVGGNLEVDIAAMQLDVQHDSNRKLAHELDVSCDVEQECGFHVLVRRGLRNDIHPVRVNMTYDATVDGLLRTVMNLVGPTITYVATPEHLNDNFSGAILMHRRWGNSGEEAAFNSVCDSLREDHELGNRVGCAVIASKSSLPAGASIVMRTPEFKLEPAPPTLVTSQKHDLENWARGMARPLIQALNWETLFRLEEVELPFVRIILDDRGLRTDDSHGNPSHVDVPMENELHAKASALAGNLPEKHRGRLIFVHERATNVEASYKEWGLATLDKTPHPLVVVSDNLSFEADSYVLMAGGSAPLTTALLQQHLSRYVSGELTPTRKSEALAEARTLSAGVLNHLTWNMLHAEMQKSQWLEMLVVVQQDDKQLENKRGRKLTRTLGRIARAAGQVAPGMIVATYDSDLNYVPKDVFQDVDPMHFVPECFLFLNGTRAPAKMPLDGGGLPNEKRLLRFLKRTSKTLSQEQGQWGRFKSALASVKSSDKAARAEELAETRRLVAEAERAFERGFFFLEKNVLSMGSSHSVVKYITKRGSGAYPSRGSTVRATYKGMLADGTVFDEHDNVDDPFEFPLGSGHVIKCWDKAFASMAVGEAAVLRCGPTAAYGDKGYPPRIPAGAMLRFDVKLLGFDGGAPRSEL